MASILVLRITIRNDNERIIVMKLIKTEEAVGHVLCHDLTQIIPGKIKDAAFRKGHIVTKEDIPVLLSMGKEHLYVWEACEGMLHEDEGAKILKDICINNHMTCTEVKEGKVEILADTNGLLKVDTKVLNSINALGEIMIATRHGNFPVKAGDKLAATRVIPLIIEKEKMDKAVFIAGSKPILELKPFIKRKVGIVTTGSEVFKGRIEDKFGPAIRAKLQEYDADILGQRIVDDSIENISKAIQEYIDEGADMVLCTGGMSVDPDDRTPGAIKAIGTDIVTYGAPVLPGAMFLLGYYNESVPVIGLPGCVMYAKRTIFDLVLPRLFAGEKLTAEDIYTLGEGGLCLNCNVCTFPNCGFGK